MRIREECHKLKCVAKNNGECKFSSSYVMCVVGMFLCLRICSRRLGTICVQRLLVREDCWTQHHIYLWSSSRGYLGRVIAPKEYVSVSGLRLYVRWGETIKIALSCTAGIWHPGFYVRTLYRGINFRAGFFSNHQANNTPSDTDFSDTEDTEEGKSSVRTIVPDLPRISKQNTTTDHVIVWNNLPLAYSHEVPSVS